MHWRVTLKSIRPDELRVIPCKLVDKLEKIIQRSVPTKMIECYELDKRSMKKLSSDMLEQATQ